MLAICIPLDEGGVELIGSSGSHYVIHISYLILEIAPDVSISSKTP